MKARAVLGTCAAIAALTALMGIAAFAQGPGGGGPGGGGFGPPGGGFGPPHGGGPGGRQSEVNVSIDILTPELGLTSDQADKVRAIQAKFKDDRDALMPSPDDSQGPPDRETMRANMMKMRTLESAARKKIDAELTDSQSKSLPALLKSLADTHAVGIPSGVYESLKLTDDEKSKIAALAKSKNEKARKFFRGTDGERPDFDTVRTQMQKLNTDTEQSALDILTDDQKSLVASYKSDNSDDNADQPGPPPGFGGGPGGGGPGGGGPGGGGPGGGGPDDGGLGGPGGPDGGGPGPGGPPDDQGGPPPGQ